MPSVRANQAEGGRRRRSHASAAAAQRVSPYGKGVTRSASGWQLGQRHWRCARVGTPRPPGQPLRRLHASALADGIGRSSAGSIRRIGRDRLSRRRWAEGSTPGWTHALRTDAIRHRCWSRSHLQMSRRECEIGRECGGLSIDLFVVRLIPNICACKQKQTRPRGNHAQRGYPVRRPLKADGMSSRPRKEKALPQRAGRTISWMSCSARSSLLFSTPRSRALEFSRPAWQSSDTKINAA